jgi:hypothetical protein
MRRSVVVALLASVGLLGRPVLGAAQDACNEDIHMPSVGAWAEYEATIRGEQKTLRYALIGQEDRDGKKLSWIEVLLKGKKEDQNIVYQVLVPKFPFDPTEIYEAVFKSGKNQAMKVGPMMMRVVQSGIEKNGFNFSELCKEIHLEGSESKTVQGGTFQTRHYKSERYENNSWLARSAPFGLIESNGRDSQGTDYTITLYRQGEGAKSSIKETPGVMP